MQANPYFVLNPPRPVSVLCFLTKNDSGLFPVSVTVQFCGSWETGYYLEGKTLLRFHRHKSLPPLLKPDFYFESYFSRRSLSAARLAGGAACLLMKLNYIMKKMSVRWWTICLFCKVNNINMHFLGLRESIPRKIVDWPVCNSRTSGCPARSFNGGPSNPRDVCAINDLIRLKWNAPDRDY